MPRPRDLERHDSRASLRREAALWQGSHGSRLIDARESGCRSSVVEHSLGKGEVVSSILTGSTRKAPTNRHFLTVALPCPPRGKRERGANVPQKLGENWGTLF